MPRDWPCSEQQSKAAALDFVDWMKDKGRATCTVSHRELDTAFAQWPKRLRKTNASLNGVKRALKRLGAIARRQKHGSLRAFYWCIWCKHARVVGEGSEDAEDDVDAQSAQDTETGDADTSEAEEETTEVPTGGMAKRVARAFVAWLDMKYRAVCSIDHDLLQLRYKEWQAKNKDCLATKVTTKILHETLCSLGATKRRQSKATVRSFSWCLKCSHATIWQAPMEDTASEDETNEEPITPAGIHTSVAPATVPAVDGPLRRTKTVAKRTYDRLRRCLHRVTAAGTGKLRFSRRSHGAYSGTAVGIMNSLRAAGLGSRKVATITSDIMRGVERKRWKGRKVSRTTVRKYDAAAATGLRNRIFRHLGSFSTHTSLTQDSSAGSRTHSGVKFSTVSVSMMSPGASTRCVQVVADVRSGLDGSAEAKVRQIDDVKEVIRHCGLDQPRALLTDHEAAARKLASLCDMTWAGCVSHKMKHTFEAANEALFGPNFVVYLETLFRATSSATVSTTGSGPRIQSALKVENAGGTPGFRQVRQTGTRYCWELLACCQVLCFRDRLLHFHRSGELVIPGSSALVRIRPQDEPGLLEDEQVPILCVASVCYTAFVHSLYVLKGCESDHQLGELSITESRKRFREISEKLAQLGRARTKVPEWIPRNAQGMSEALERWSPRCGELLRLAARKMMATFKRFMSYDPNYSRDDLKDLETTPATNDFTEGCHGTLSHLSGRLPNSNPHRLAALTQLAHNSGVARRLCLDTFPDDDDLDVATAFPSNEEAQRQVHRSQTLSLIRGKLEKMKKPALVSLARELTVPSEALTADALRRALELPLYDRDFAPKSASSQKQVNQ